eukprot:GILK01002989.1.p1 GENE.GILK01002989.1~~GILK01002989.1.p1  ORF type:complete len:458 (+),score=61.76 GILK01002989.1:59-1432(+)
MVRFLVPVARLRFFALFALCLLSTVRSENKKWTFAAVDEPVNDNENAFQDSLPVDQMSHFKQRSYNNSKHYMEFTFCPKQGYCGGQEQLTKMNALLHADLTSELSSDMSVTLKFFYKNNGFHFKSPSTIRALCENGGNNHADHYVECSFQMRNNSEQIQLLKNGLVTALRMNFVQLPPQVIRRLKAHGWTPAYVHDFMQDATVDALFEGDSFQLEKQFKKQPLNSWKFLGCFQDERKPRDLHHFAGSSSNMTTEKCQRECGLKGFRYAGVQYGDYCFCGNTVGRYGTTAEIQCSVPCSGNASQTCGGLSSNSVYTNLGLASALNSYETFQALAAEMIWLLSHEIENNFLSTSVDFYKKKTGDLVFTSRKPEHFKESVRIEISPSRIEVRHYYRAVLGPSFKNPIPATDVHLGPCDDCISAIAYIDFLKTDNIKYSVLLKAEPDVEEDDTDILADLLV